MKDYRIINAAAAILGYAAIGATIGCADPRDDEPRSTEVAADDDDATALGAPQFVPPSNAGARSGDHIAIESISASGSGCPSGSWTTDEVPEGNAFTLTFEKYSSEAPATPTATRTQLACTLSLKVRTPKDLSYVVTSLQYFGYAKLSTGMKASLQADYAFTGDGFASGSRSFRYDFPVPHDTTYAINDELGARGVAASSSPCNVESTLHIRTQLTLESTSRDQPAILTLDNVDARGQGALKLNIQTSSCSSP